MDENAVEQAEVIAPEQEATAAPEPEVIETPEAEKQPEKTFTQEELDQIVSKRLAREQRKWEREQRMHQPAAQQPNGDVKLEQFESPEQYAEVLAYQKAQQMIQQREIQQQQAQMLDAYHDKEEDARNRYDDFEQVAYNPRLPITEVMAQTIQASDMGPDVAYYLGMNPKEAERISRLAPVLQAKEIGRIEAKVASEPPKPKTTNAPAPIAPVTPRGTSPAYDTTDPRSIKSMSASEWIEAERERQRKKWERERR